MNQYQIKNEKNCNKRGDKRCKRKIELTRARHGYMGGATDLNLKFSSTEQGEESKTIPENVTSPVPETLSESIWPAYECTVLNQFKQY